MATLYEDEVEKSKPCSRTRDVSNSPYHLKSIDDFAKDLNAAVKSAFPNSGRGRYTGVYVLFLRWKDDELGVFKEIEKLGEVLRTKNNFLTEEYLIPSNGQPQRSLTKKLLGFMDDHEAQDSLLILYYGGHGDIQTQLAESKSDVLILLDCCAAGSSVDSTNSGVVIEVIAACEFESKAPLIGEHSFTSNLIYELEYLATRLPFSAAALHTKVLSRIMWHNPRYEQGGRGKEKRKTPIHILLSCEAERKCIELSPLPKIQVPVEDGVLQSKSSTDSDFQISEYPGSPEVFPDSDVSPPDSLDFPPQEIWPDARFRCPKDLITVALEEHQWLYRERWIEWLQSIPAFASCVHVEGVYKSESTLLILSLPVAVWDLLSEHVAISFIAFVRSRNLLNLSVEA
ncbi:MAG: hypothetical protein MMC33_001246 [Icmadophila ericetorum]|nr:hypothetical protein [Icmadophila ericetorum]